MGGLRGLVRAFVLGGFAAGGVLASHWLGFRLAISDHHHRGQVLEQTGHQYWGYLIAALVGLVVGAAALFLTIRLRSRSTHCSRTRLFRYAFLRLLPLGMLSFVGLEAIERSLFATHSGHPLFEEAAVQIGIAAQLIVALLGALLLVLISVVADLFRATGVRRTSRATSPRQPLNQVVVLDAARLGGCGNRAPPALSF